MGYARRKPWVLSLARRYVHRTLRRRFDGLFVEGLEQAQAHAAREPLIVAATHVAFWDALVALQLDALLQTESYALMDAAGLARYPFFGWVGALPLHRGPAKQTLLEMRAASALLDRPGRALWIFPQGRQRPPHLRPFELQPGVLWLSRAARARVLPLSLSYAYREAPEPSIVASFGAPLAAGAPSLLRDLAAQWDAALGRIDGFVDRGEGDFAASVPSRLGEQHGVPVAGRALAWWSRQRRLGTGGVSS
jgi:1-acyl-sn-glycerol-3-phosphate acyltransferase